MRRAASIGLAGLAATALSCTGAGGFGGAMGGTGGAGAGGEASSSCGGDFGASAAANKVETFIAAATTFTSTAAELQQSLLDACNRMGGALAIAPGELQASGDTPAVQAACERVARQIREDTAALRQASAGVRVQLVTTPPVCEVSVDAYAQCAGQCDASVDPGHADVQCEGGELRGTCSGSCTGRCAVDVRGQCGGRCEGTCSGSCTGVCQGTCQGTCRTRGPDGQCNGACQGTCQGTCSAGCTGSCEGSCEVSGQAQCSGECRGGCSVAYTEPRCTGHVVPPHMSAECQASCNARVNAQANCRPGQAHLVITGGLSGDAQARADRLRAAIEGSFATIASVTGKLQRLHDSGQALVDTGRDLPNAVQELGLGAARAVACVGQAAAALPGAVGSVNVSVQVSVSVSASASASGG